ncbi:MAG: BPSL0067 family protein [Pirellula sp.]
MPGTSVPLSHAEKYKDKVLGSAPYVGQCAAGVQQVFSEAGKSLGVTSTWKQGIQVKGNNVLPGTAIASFKNGKYWHHAAIFIRQTSIGLEVWDQWDGQKWHTRTLRFNDKDTADGSNNGNLFFVID